MKKTGKLRMGACLVAAALLLGACGQAGAPAGPQAEATETAEVSKSETGGTDAPSSEKESASQTATTAKAEESEEPKGPDEEVDASEEETATETETATVEPSLEEVTPPQETTAAPQTDGGKSVNDIYQDITQTVALNAPMLMSDDFISNYYGIDVNTLDEYVFSMSEIATSAETVVILKAKDGGSTGQLSTSLQTVIDQKKAETENYLPDQFQIVDKSSVQVSGNYVYLVISPHADSINPIIQAGIQ